jgi:hypothetical protein
MKSVDLAVRVSSVHELHTPYTATGLGDRIHLMTIAWAYANTSNSFVTMHISSNAMTARKRESFEEIISLFPEGRIALEIHSFEGTNENVWLKYLSDKGILAIPYYYGDHLGRYEKKIGIDISVYLKQFPKLSQKSEPVPILDLPLKFFTTQWDSTAPTRTLPESSRMNITDKYCEQGSVPVTLGGESLQAPLRDSLSAASAAISKAEAHVGVDSGFMHLAFLYLEFSKIHLYIEPKGYWTHHLFRAFDNGCIQNYHYIKPTILQTLRIKLLYDSQLMNAIVFSHPRILNGLRRIGNLSKLLRAQA